MAGHSIRISAETYARVILAAAAAKQSVSAWMESAAHEALRRQQYDAQVASFRIAQRRAADNLEPSPLPRDFGLANPRA